jgi:hypothetical protein
MNEQLRLLWEQNLSIGDISKIINVASELVTQYVLGYEHGHMVSKNAA